MKLCGVCILTDNAPRLAAFYEILYQQPPFVEDQHYSFDSAQLSVYNPGDINVVKDKNMQLMCFVPDVMAEYHRLLKAIPDIVITSPPERRPWGTFSFWLLDSDGNTVSLVEKQEDEI